MAILVPRIRRAARGSASRSRNLPQCFAIALDSRPPFAYTNRKASEQAAQMKIDWHKVHTYTGGKSRNAVVERGGSRLPRVYRGEKAAKTKAERRRLRPRKISTSGKNKGKPEKNPGVVDSLRIGNMQSDFGVTLNGRKFRSVETAYIAGCYSQEATGAKAKRLADIQEKIRTEENGFTAKRHWRLAKRGMPESWEAFESHKAEYQAALKLQRTADWSLPWHYEWMLFLDWLKIEQNPDFAKRILQIPKTKPIIELAGEDNASPDWGCKEIKPGVYRGENHFGIIFMECRRAILEREAPDIDWEELNRRGIYLFGERLTFAPPKPLPKEFYSALASERQKAHCREAGKASAAKRAESFGTVAATIGAKGGKVKSAAKVEAARRNIAKAIAARKAKAAAKSKA